MKNGINVESDGYGRTVSIPPYLEEELERRAGPLAHTSSVSLTPHSAGCYPVIEVLLTHCSHHSIPGGLWAEKAGSVLPGINYLRLVRTGSDGFKRFRFPLALPVSHRLTGFAL